MNNLIDFNVCSRTILLDTIHPQEIGLSMTSLLSTKSSIIRTTDPFCVMVLKDEIEILVKRNSQSSKINQQKVPLEHQLNTHETQVQCRSDCTCKDQKPRRPKNLIQLKSDLRHSRKANPSSCISLGGGRIGPSELNIPSESSPML